MRHAAPVGSSMEMRATSSLEAVAQEEVEVPRSEATPPTATHGSVISHPWSSDQRPAPDRPRPNWRSHRQRSHDSGLEAAAGSTTNANREMLGAGLDSAPPSPQLNAGKALTSPPPHAVSLLPWDRKCSPWAHLVVRGSSPHTVNIGRRWQRDKRTDTWGNDFVMCSKSSAERVRVCNAHAQQLLSQGPQSAIVRQARTNLRGCALSCHCAPLQCHGDLLAYVANCDEADLCAACKLYKPNAVAGALAGAQLTPTQVAFVPVFVPHRATSERNASSDSFNTVQESGEMLVYVPCAGGTFQAALPPGERA